jgi:hypothetical protein
MDWMLRDWIEHSSFGIGWVIEDRVDRLDIYFLNAGKRTILKTSELKRALPPSPDFKFPNEKRKSSDSQSKPKSSPRRPRVGLDHVVAPFVTRHEEWSKESGNVAFKVTWVYGKSRPFGSPCTSDGREINIRKEKRIWCSNQECLCNKLYRSGDLREVTLDERPCMDSEIFTAWRFGGGTYHNGPRKDEPISIKHARPGKLAFFTSRQFDKTEAERLVLGCYEIDDVEFDSKRGGTFLRAKKGSEIKVNLDNPDGAPRFWTFYKISGPPLWGTGLFRYLSDEAAKKLRDAVATAAAATNP